jgi:hypothetical protein
LAISNFKRLLPGEFNFVAFPERAQTVHGFGTMSRCRLLGLANNIPRQGSTEDGCRQSPIPFQAKHTG